MNVRGFINMLAWHELIRCRVGWELALDLYEVA